MDTTRPPPDNLLSQSQKRVRRHVLACGFYRTKRPGFWVFAAWGEKSRAKQWLWTEPYVGKVIGNSVHVVFRFTKSGKPYGVKV